jgi:hypothetical protein
MQTNMTEESSWAAGVAARLRLLQVTCADAGPARRREFLDETVAEAIRDLPAARKRSYLAALAEHFPSWSAPVPISAPEAVPPAPHSPLELLEQLLPGLPELPPQARDRLVKRLVEAGWVPARSPAASGPPALEIQAALGLERPPGPDHALKLLTVLADLVEKMDQVACRTLENLPDRPDFKTVAEGDLRESMKQFLGADAGGDPEAPLQTLRRTFEKHRRAMVALMASHAGMKGVPSAGREFAKWFLEYFSPQILEDVVRSEKSGMFGLGGGLEERCWKKFAQRFREHLSTPEHIDRRVKEAVANSVERIHQLRM